eukprot:2158853-Prymnesium_polylepis.1
MAINSHSAPFRWERVSAFVGNQRFSAKRFGPQWIALSAGHVWVLGEDGCLHGPNGIVWASLRLDGVVHARKFDVAHDNSSVWCVDAAGNTFAGELAGDAVKFREVAAPATATQVACSSERVAIASTDGEHVFVSEDSGATWTDAGMPLAGGDGRVVEIDIRGPDGSI